MSRDGYPNAEKLKAGRPVIDFMEWLRDNGWQVQRPILVTYNEECSVCKGYGFVIGKGYEACTWCHAEGQVEVTRESYEPLGEKFYEYLGVDPVELERERRRMIRSL